MQATKPFHKRVIEWAIERKFHTESTAAAQEAKAFEEFGEACGALARLNGETDPVKREMRLNQLKDGIGDTLVVLTIMSLQLGREAIWDERERTGEPIINYPSYSVAVIASQIAEYRFDRARDMLAVMAREHGLTLDECQEQAWGEIKDRKGEMRGGRFIKAGD